MQTAEEAHPMPDFSVTSVAHTIQLSVAPVFLLTALATFLNVLGTRLSRIVDRARVISEGRPDRTAQVTERMRAELPILRRRRRFVNVALTAGVTSMLLVCIIIASLFVATVLGLKASSFTAALFVAAMVAFITGLVAFLREVLLAVSSSQLFDDL